VGLFDTPAVKVRKWLPQNLGYNYDLFAANVDDLLPIHLKKFDRAQMVGFVMAAWGLQEHRRGEISIDANNGQRISEFGTFLANKIGDDMHYVNEVIEHFSLDGVITPPTWAKISDE